MAEGVANPNVIDAFGFDQQKGEVLLVMREARPWNGGDEQLHELQEKFNAYASFILDGEMLDSHPEFAGKVRQGFNPASRRALMEKLMPLRTDKCPFANLPSSKKSHFGEGVTAD
ncbi:MAG: DUF6572 domain-containing protein, partial [Chthoniobacterales bacterium]